MLTLNIARPIATIFAIALVLSATGCSSTRNQAALANIRSFTRSARAVALASAAKPTVAIHRHPREHALAAVRPAQTLRHQSARSL